MTDPDNVGCNSVYLTASLGGAIFDDEMYMENAVQAEFIDHWPPKSDSV